MNTHPTKWLPSGLRQLAAAFSTSRVRPFLLSGLTLALAALMLLAMSLISTRTGLAAPQTAPPAARLLSTNVGGNIYTDTTWTLAGSPYIVVNSVTVQPGATLTVEAGVEVYFAGPWVLSVYGGLIAEGTVTQPIIFNVVPPAVYYSHIRFYPGSHVRLDYCDISRAGNEQFNAVVIESSDVVIDHCTIHDNVAYNSALLLTGPNSGAGLSPTIRNTTISSNTGYAIWQGTVDMTPLYQNLTFTNNGTDAVYLSWGTINRPVTLDGPQLNGSPFIAANLYIAPSQTLTLTPGTELRSTSARVLEVQENGTLIAQGTPTRPITITAHPPGGTWGHIRFYPGSHVRLDYCDISRAASGDFNAVQIESSDVVIDHCTIHDNVAYNSALLLTGPNSGAGLSPTIRNTTISSNTGYAIWQGTVDMTPLYQNLTFTNNGTDAVLLTQPGGTTINRPVTLDGPQLNGSPFIAANLYIAPSQTLTLTPGTELRSTSARVLEVQENGTLIAQGTPTRPITITAHPPGGTYRYIRFYSNSHVRLDYCDISRAGAGSDRSIWIASSDVVINHCQIHDNVGSQQALLLDGVSLTMRNTVVADNIGAGVRLVGGARLDALHTTMARNDTGVYVDGSGTAALTNTILYSHTVGVRVTGSGQATLAHTLWDHNITPIVGSVNEIGHLDGPAAFDADGYHLTRYSAALEKGLDAGVTDDIDGQARPLPAGTLPDLGADECALESDRWRIYLPLVTRN